MATCNPYILDQNTSSSSDCPDSYPNTTNAPREAMEDGPSYICTPATYVGNPDGSPWSWLNTSPALAVAELTNGWKICLSLSHLPFK